MDLSGDGEVSLDEFMNRAEDPELRAFFSSLDLEIGDARHFFYMLSGLGTKSVKLSHFVSGCIRLRGAAQALDLNEMMNKQEIMNRTMELMTSRLREQSEMARLCASRQETHSDTLAALPEQMNLFEEHIRTLQEQIRQLY